ncbi:MAG: transposase [Flavisolibacter sp.]|nr:transposase [Flavisolibacter sp.]MBD0374676.1 transposase [Flavisolibacter sp.]
MPRLYHSQNIDGAFVAGRLEELSLCISRQTVVVLDGASPHHSKRIKERLPYWRKRGWWLFYLPPYSPHLNLAEDYGSAEQLFYATNQCLKAVGNTGFINVSPFDLN